MAPSGAFLFLVVTLFARLTGRWALALVLTLGLCACASSTNPLAGVLSAVVTERLGSGDKSVLSAQPNPAYRYLRAEVAGRPAALLVLGYIDAHAQGEIEVWYSAKGEVIKTQNGRIVATAGLETDWRAVRFPSAPPLWTEVPLQGSAYARVHDEMPGYRDNISERLELKPWQGELPIVLPASLTGAQAHTYRWFREATLTSSAPPLPPAWYAWGMHRGQPGVVYSEQCLSATLCLKLQRWPVQEEPS